MEHIISIDEALILKSPYFPAEKREKMNALSGEKSAFLVLFLGFDNSIQRFSFGESL